MAWIGIDVSKAKLDAAWLRDATRGKFKDKVFPNTPAGHQALLAWAERQSCTPLAEVHFVMEATGVYHEALACALHDAGARVSVVNPAQVRDYAKSLGVRSKNDRRDSRVLARFGESRRPALWQPEPREIRELKALLARLEALDGDIRRELNRQEKAQISQASEEVLASIRTMHQQLEQEKQRLLALIDDHIDRHPHLKQDRHLLESIPGVGPVVSRCMISLVRSRSFTGAAQCAAYLGLIPVEHQSGTSVRGRPRLSKAGNTRLRAKLYMAAVVAVRCNPDVKALYQRLLARGKCKMSALGAAMRKLVHICFGVLKHRKPYQAQATLLD